MATTKTNTDPAVWSGVLALHGLVEQELGKALSRRHGLGLSEYRALSLLAVAEDGELRIQELAEELGLNQSSVSRIVARLEDAGLTRRAICDNDRRGVYSVILPEGRRRQADAEPSYRDTLSTALDRAAADPALAAVVDALRT